MKENIKERIQALRNEMRQAGVDAVIIPQTDPHQSEYLASHWQVRRWLSGFTGSAGDIVVTLDGAWLWADSRYWLQSAMQLEGTEIKVMYEGKPETPDIIDFLISHLKSGSTVGIDGMLFSVNKASSMEERLAKRGIKLRVDFAPIDKIWTDRPVLPKNEVFIHDLKYAAEDVASKVAKIMDDVKDQGAETTFISDLAEIAWTLNIRSNDVNCNPVVTSFLYISPQKMVLFIDKDKLTQEVADYLSSKGVETKGYNDVATFISNLPESERVLINPNQTAVTIVSLLGDRVVFGSSPIAMLKAVKNATQIAGIRAAMVRDGVALVKTYMEIEKCLKEGKRITEIDADNLALSHRRAYPEFFDKSFESASAYGPNGAIVHYEADEESNAVIGTDSLYLFDSGVNYLDGTTDITRTVTFGVPTQAQRRDFTLVMKGHIAIASAVFPVGTTGHQLDVLARLSLWKEGLSYLHGTGHGVGHFLNVHEGPQSIRLNDTHAPLTPGMITSNEPGLYREGVYGIRCENLVLTVDAFTTEFGHFLKFETLTLFPFDVSLFETSIMTEQEIEWVNSYNSMVCERLLPYLDPKEQEWLIAKSIPLVKD